MSNVLKNLDGQDIELINEISKNNIGEIEISYVNHCFVLKVRYFHFNKIDFLVKIELIHCFRGKENIIKTRYGYLAKWKYKEMHELINLFCSKKKITQKKWLYGKIDSLLKEN